MTPVEYAQIKHYMYPITELSSSLPRADLAIFTFSALGVKKDVEVHIHTNTWHQGSINVRWVGDPSGHHPLANSAVTKCVWINKAISIAKDNSWI